MWIGAGLATANGIAVLIVTLAMLSAYHYRIQSEEHMLSATRGQKYNEYKARTWKLIPFIY